MYSALYGTRLEDHGSRLDAVEAEVSDLPDPLSAHGVASLTGSALARSFLKWSRQSGMTTSSVPIVTLRKQGVPLPQRAPLRGECAGM